MTRPIRYVFLLACNYCFILIFLYSGKSAKAEQFFHTFTKYYSFDEVEIPYEELFDRFIL